ncbi:3-hydroxyacyl-CoA dehydrogenase family protein [Granulicella sibirica]|uniref:3-hydroxybutyryl-CoA dehydrogenase n=1 Tax=Granulicella sibirica TaxID=2479048 RepID=A0A4V1L509_9BACT|nr:3-hydroxyacyl-CoA dehydrogenase family protein [Granulicella sibirica]RXH54124.1 3-hydroxybutyryl-CoA dehydrogenase [Granulicella sibirica]
MNVQVVGIVGLGFMGRNVAGCLLASGLGVVSYTLLEQEYVEARVTIAKAIEELIERAGYDPALREEWSARYTEAGSIGELAGCGFVLESITESLEAKNSLFADLESVLGASVPIASNTSALPISLLQKGHRHPERFLGMHWAEPAHATRFLELIRGDLTDDFTMETATVLAKRLGKDPCVVQQDLPGFIANRMGYAMYREACNLLALGVGDAETIDKAFSNTFGLWASVCGPFRWIDLTGGPALYGKAMSGVLPTLSNTAEVPEPMATMMRDGLTGVKCGQGFHSYTPEETARWEEIYREQVWRVRRVVDEVFPIAESGRL